MKKILLSALLILFASTAQVGAHDEPCGLELLNVPVGATIRVAAYWKSDDPDEAIEDEGYKFIVDDGGSGGTMTIWRQPFVTYNMVPFSATGSRVSISGFKDPQSTMHNEGAEREGCVITATINSLPPWVKDYARVSFPYVSLGAMGVGTLGYFVPHPGIKGTAVGLVAVSAVAKFLADDPIDCSTVLIARPVFIDAPIGAEDDAIGIIGNKIARNGTRTLAIARAAVINANRANCNEFTKAQRTALFRAAQNQGYRIGNHLARLSAQLANFTALLEQSGIVLDVTQGQFLLEDTFYNFMALDDPAIDNQFLQIMPRDELDNLKDGFLGVPLIDFHACNDGSGPCRLYPALWPTDGIRSMLPALDRWAASLIAKEAGL